MPIYLHSNPGFQIEFRRDMPDDYRGPLLRGSRILHYAKDECKLIIQEIVTEFFTMRLNVFRFFETIALDSSSSKKGIHSRMVLKGNLSHKIKGAGKIFLKEGEFTMIWADEANCHCKFDKDIEYTTFDVFYAPEFFEELVILFPELQNIVHTGKVINLVRNPAFITPVMHNVVQQILQCPFDEATRQFYFDLKLREYLYIMLEHTYQKKFFKYRINRFEKARVIKAHEILLEDLSKKPPTIRELAAKVSISEYRLREGFNQLFGLSIFECLQEARMERARQLLLGTNEPLKNICLLTGYSRMTNFITAFRTRFGYTPGSLRRK